MLRFFAENWGTIIVCAVIAAAVAAIAVKMVRDKRRGKPIGCDCDCGCEGCTKARCDDGI
ncbi:MAG: FeoB-associated Cys-rich membrane protein [Oscillospiraceae bacterium]|jgi:1-aminocyclopropane-1-carboxylate deaminase/D-cysteine desulfhydrase-like pyridoxal-dependent ACC family enzyme|nr:FeoB-associated Cys-rich membrane protein [Oscillospiraceae bacterium]